MEPPAFDAVRASPPDRIIVEGATVMRRARRLAADLVRRDAAERTLASLAVTDRDRFAGVDRRLMPDRLRLPPEIVELFSLEPTW